MLKNRSKKEKKYLKKTPQLPLEDTEPALQNSKIQTPKPVSTSFGLVKTFGEMDDSKRFLR